MRVGIDHSGNDGFPAGIVHTGRRTLEELCFTVRSDEDDATTADGERLDKRTGIVSRVNASVGDDEVRRLRGWLLRCKQRWQVKDASMS